MEIAPPTKMPRHSFPVVGALFPTKTNSTHPSRTTERLSNAIRSHLILAPRHAFAKRTILENKETRRKNTTSAPPLLTSEISATNGTMLAASSFRSSTLGFQSRSRRARTPPTRRNFTVRAGIQPGVDLVTEGKVRLVRANELKAVLVDEGYKILDTRPDYENERAQVKGAIHVPYFSVDDGQDPLTWIRRGMHAGFGGVWNGVPLTKVNENFIEAVTEAVEGNKEVAMVVTCSQGLRSLVSIKDLHDNGFTNLAWLYGGLNFAEDGVETDGEVTLAEANTGGVSKIVVDLIESMQKKDGGVSQ